MARSDPQINLRIPSALKERVEAAALANRRSMNAEIAARLEQSFEVPPAAEVLDFRELPPGALDGAMARAIISVMDQRPDVFVRKKKDDG